MMSMTAMLLRSEPASWAALLLTLGSLGTMRYSGAGDRQQSSTSALMSVSGIAFQLFRPAAARDSE